MKAEVENGYLSPSVKVDGVGSGESNWGSWNSFDAESQKESDPDSSWASALVAGIPRGEDHLGEVCPM